MPPFVSLPFDSAKARSNSTEMMGLFELSVITPAMSVRPYVSIEPTAPPCLDGTRALPRHLWRC